MSTLEEKLKESGCSQTFIEDAMRYEKLYKGNIEGFIDTVENLLMNDEAYDDSSFEEDEDDDDDELNDPIYQSDYNYDGNEDDIYFEDDDGEEPFEEDEED